MSSEFIEKAKIKISNCTVIDNNGCWNWNRCVTKAGYSVVIFNKEYWYGHRLSYFAYYGHIPRGKKMNIDHLCRNRKCVNPEHLEEVTAKENLMRGEAIAAKNKRKLICKRGHKFDVLYVKPNGNLERKCSKCIVISNKNRYI